MRRPIAAIALVLSLATLAVSSAAQARKPLISYLDAQGSFQLYDAEAGANVSPAPPVPVPAEHNVNQFTWGMSLDGRYIVFTDAKKKLHLLDRSSNQEVPLPGIDKVGQPANLTVSNTGLIGYDNNSNKPTYVYDSVAETLFNTGLDAKPQNPTNERRQPRISGDGKFMVTTCFDNNESTCFTTGDGDSDVLMQNLVTKQQVPNFPDEPKGMGKDEEHPCINNDGTLIAVEKPNPMQKDIFLFSRSGNTFTPLATPNLNDEKSDDRFCQLSPGGGYISDIQNNNYKLYERSTNSFVSLPSLPFDSRSTLSSPYAPPSNTPANTPSNAPANTLSAQATVTGFSMKNKRFRVAKQPTAVNARKLKGAPRGSTFLYSLSTAATVRIDIFQRQPGRSVGGKCVKPSPRLRKKRKCTRSVLKGSITRRAAVGSNKTPFSGRIGRRALNPGQYQAKISAGNVKSTSFTIVR